MRRVFRHQKGAWREKYRALKPYRAGSLLMATDEGKQTYRYKVNGRTGTRTGQIVRKLPKSPSKKKRRRLGIPR